MASSIRLAVSIAALAGGVLGDKINWALLDAAGPATGFVSLTPDMLAADPIADYTDAVSLGSVSIAAPMDCQGQDTYLGQRVYTDGPMSVSRCADDCSAQHAYAKATNDGEKACRFFDTYTIEIAPYGNYSNAVPAGQICSLYTDTWPASYATDRGQWRDQDLYFISNSYAASYAADPSSGNCPVSLTTSTAEPAATSITDGAEIDITTGSTSSTMATVTVTTTEIDTISITEGAETDITMGPTSSTMATVTVTMTETDATPLIQ
ncbi:hypothetical protein PG994_003134 [Apiospora phragmitis]|uniref:Uncharacterized protein n=1 Tax=Apiospora phragmitis TaxID=2905665 RepID=A0ABR1W8F3_9PEZI